MSAGLSTLDLPPTNGHASVHKMPSSSNMGMEDDEEDTVFDSPEEEIAHYREKYRQAMDMLSETRAELEEFQQSSRELEDEMEQELAANEKQQDELRERIKRIEAEKEEWKAKQIALQKMHSSTTAAMQREMDNLRSERDKTLVALRDLEMGNDELERNERVAVSSLLDLESKYNRAIEEKTLLEQEVVQRQELEEECQRLKDEMRDANSEISILRDQLARQTLPTPPSSVSETAQMSPVQEASREISVIENEVDPASIPLPPPVKYKFPTEFATPQSPSRKGIPRSATSSALPISTSSPVPRRFQTTIPQSPTMSSLSRSTTSRNLAAAAGPQSPALSRSRSGIPHSSPARVPGGGALPLQSHQQTKSRGFKLLHDLQARLKATDDKLGVAKVPRRNVSNPLSFGVKRIASASSTKTSTNTSTAATTAIPEKEPKVPHARVAALAGRDDMTPQLLNMTSSSSNLMSPNGWVLIDGDNEDTPTAQGHGQSGIMGFPDEPRSPLDPTFGAGVGCGRAVSSAASNSSQRSLPSRPGIPSPLANVSGLNQSTKLNKAASSGLSRSTSTKLASIRPSSRAASTTVSRHTKKDSHSHSQSRRDGIDNAASRQPLSPTSTGTGPCTGTGSGVARPASSLSTSRQRPMSPSMIPTSSRPMSPGMMVASALSPSSRPMSPSMLPTYRSMRAPSPVVAFPTGPSSSSASRPLSRADSNNDGNGNGNRRASGIGKGPPPSAHRQSTLPTNGVNPLSTSTNGNAPGQSRRSTRRSSVGANEHTRPTGIPAPRDGSQAGGGARTPGRPTSVHVFGDNTPPPVPRIPSALLKGDRERKK
ncbi:hypothetical protein IAU59_007287 [Kwoniella sp. CBS 9459]